jgi:hypothetical protein
LLAENADTDPLTLAPESEPSDEEDEERKLCQSVRYSSHSFINLLLAKSPSYYKPPAFESRDGPPPPSPEAAGSSQDVRMESPPPEERAPSHEERALSEQLKERLSLVEERPPPYDDRAPSPPLEERLPPPLRTEGGPPMARVRLPVPVVPRASPVRDPSPEVPTSPMVVEEPSPESPDAAAGGSSPPPQSRAPSEFDESRYKHDWNFEFKRVDKEDNEQVHRDVSAIEFDRRLQITRSSSTSNSFTYFADFPSSHIRERGARRQRAS